MILSAFSRFRVIGLRDLRLHWARTLVSTLVVAVAAGLLIAVLGTYGSLTGSVERLAATVAGNANFEITGVTDTGFSADELAVVRSVSGVGAAVPMLRSTEYSSVGPVQLYGVDSSITSLDSDLQQGISASASALSTPNGVLVGSATGLTAGQTLTIGNTVLNVVGTIDGAGTERLSGGSFVVAPLALAQTVTGRDGQLDSIFVVDRPGADLQTVSRDITTAVSGRVSVNAADFRVDRANIALSLTRNATLMVSLIAFVVAAFLVFNVMNMTIAKRRPTIALLRSIGGKRGTILRDLLGESAMIGLIGGAIGVPIGIVMGRLAIGSLPPFLLEEFDARIEYVLPGYAIPAAIVLCVIACVAASALAAVQVYKISPIEALSVGGTGTVAETPRAPTISMTVFGVVAIVGSLIAAATVEGQVTLAAGALFMFGVVGLCIAATSPMVSLTAQLPRRWGGAGRLATATIERAPRRIWATVMTIVVAVSVSVGVSGALTNLTDSATASLSSLGKTDLYVTLTSPYVVPAGATLDPAVVQQVRETPGVADVVEGQWAYATIDGQLVSIQAVEDGSSAVSLSALPDDVRSGVIRGDGVAISRTLGASLGVAAGDTLDLPTPTGIRSVRVLALVDYLNAAGGTMAISLASMQDWYQRPGATYLELTVDGGVAAVQQQLVASLPSQVFVYTGQDALDGSGAAITQAGALAIALQWIVAVVAAIALLNTLMLSVLERRRELGVLRAMGASRATLARMVLSEAVSVGIVGGVLGLAVGSGLQYLSTLILGASTGITIDYAVGASVLLYALVAVALSLIGSVPPAIHAARQNIVEAIAAD